MPLKMSYEKWRPFCRGRNVLTYSFTAGYCCKETSPTVATNGRGWHRECGFFIDYTALYVLRYMFHVKTSARLNIKMHSSHIN